MLYYLPLTINTKNLKDINSLLYRTDPQLLAALMLFHAITYVKRPQVISFDNSYTRLGI